MQTDVDAADKMIARLGDFLRLTLENSGVQEVTLQRELVFLKCYLEIEQIRLRDRLTIEMEIEPQTLDAHIPNLILQPIIENVLEEHTSDESTRERIEIRAKRRDSILQLQIRDNFYCTTPSGLDENAWKSSAGMLNTLKRLEQVYGDAHYFGFKRNLDGGWLVTLEIPFERDLLITESDKEFLQ